MASVPIHGQALGTIVFGTSFAGVTLEILDISHAGIKRNILDTTSMYTDAPGAGTFGNMTSIPSFYTDPGELTLEVLHNASILPPVSSAITAVGAIETITIRSGPATTPNVTTPASSTQAKWAGNGFITGYDPIKMPHDGQVMKATLKIKFSGPITVTAAT